MMKMDEDKGDSNADVNEYGFRQVRNLDEKKRLAFNIVIPENLLATITKEIQEKAQHAQPQLEPSLNEAA